MRLQSFRSQRPKCSDRARLKRGTQLRRALFLPPTPIRTDGHGHAPSVPCVHRELLSRDGDILHTIAAASIDNYGSLNDEHSIASCRRSLATLSVSAGGADAGATALECRRTATATTTKPLKYEMAIRTSGGTTRWLLCGGYHAEEAETALSIALGQSAPWAAVALPMDAVDHISGRAFCFLPLPILTELPLHVNANFALTSNRRELWRDEGGGAHMLKAKWNHVLCSEALPALVVCALEQIAQTGRAVAEAAGVKLAHAEEEASIRLGRLWPCGTPERQGGFWQLLQRQLLSLLHSRRSLVCFDAASATFVSLDVVTATERRLATTDGMEALRACLASCGVRLWAPPAGALAALAAAGVKVDRASSLRVCQWLAGSKKGDWSHLVAQQLLEYILPGDALAQRDENDGLDLDAGPSHANEHCGKRNSSIDGMDDDEIGEIGDDEAGIGTNGDGSGKDEGAGGEELRELLLAAPLEGLHVIPLADGSLGQLRRLRPQEILSGGGVRYFLGDAESERLLAGYAYCLGPLPLTAAC